ncbi:MAG TPA: ComF family protein [Thermodesulfobacteriota bacterium]
MLDLVFPDICLFCESAGSQENICHECLKKIAYIRGRSMCMKCGVPFESMAKDETEEYLVDNLLTARHEEHHPAAESYKMHLSSIPEHLCGRCILGEFYFERARSIAFYDGLLKEILHKFKYESKLSLGKILSSILIDNFPEDVDIPELVIPVPLYIDRLRKREYNQSVILGERLAKHLRIPSDPFVLKRIRDTKPQFEIKNDAEKRKNVKGAFTIERVERIKGKALLLIDDIFTSGSTINECARVLLKGGASCVQVLTLARAV